MCSSDLLDSVLRARAVFGQERVIVVSQRFHIERALYLARAHGMQFDGYVAADPPWRARLRTQAREVFARMGAIFDASTGRGARFGGTKVVLGQDAPT